MIKSTLETFLDLLDGAFGNAEGRTAFIKFMRQLTPEDRNELIADAQRFKTGSAEYGAIQSILVSEDDDDSTAPVN
jgi:hypothetical protein